eukprot:329202_1
MTTYSEKFTWRISETKLKQFKSCNNKDYFESKEYEIGPSIKWRLLCYPKGEKDHVTDCAFYFQLSKLNDSRIEKIIVSQQVVCNQTSGSCRDLGIYRKPVEICGWTDFLLTKKELMNLSSLQFVCTIQILKIVHKDRSIPYQYPLIINLNQKHLFSLNWKIKNEMLDKFKAYKHKNVIHQQTMHNNIWRLYCAPNGYTSNDYGSVRLGLELLAVPTDIESIASIVTLECVNKKVVFSAECVWSYDAKDIEIEWDKSKLCLRDIHELNEIHFKATIKIQNYTTFDGATHTILGKKRLLPTISSEQTEPAAKKRKLEDNFQQLYDIEKQQNKLNIMKIEMLEKALQETQTDFDFLRNENEILRGNLRKLKEESERYRLAVCSLKTVAVELPYARISQMEYEKDNQFGNFILRSRELHVTYQKIKQEQKYKVFKTGEYLIENHPHYNKTYKCNKQQIKQSIKFMKKK